MDENTYPHLVAVQRGLRTFRALGITDKEQLLYSTLVLYPVRWRLQKLSYEIGYTRTAIRPTLRGLHTIGLIEGSEADGWMVTEQGLHDGKWLMQEVADIATGVRKSLSDVLIDRVLENRTHRGAPALKDPPYNRVF